MWPDAPSASAVRPDGVRAGAIHYHVVLSRPAFDLDRCCDRYPVIQEWSMPLVLRSLVIALSVAVVACSGSSNSDEPPLTQNPPSAVNLTLLGRYSTGQFNVGAAHGVAYNSVNKTALIVNQHSNRVEVVSLSTPASPARTGELDAAAAASTALSRPMGKVAAVAAFDDPVATNDNDRIAVTVYGADVAANGAVVIYKAGDLSLVTVLQTGVGPKSVAFSHDGRYIVTANEGAPAPDYSVDPEGTIGVVDLRPTPVPPATTAPPAITVLDFVAFNVVTPAPTGSRQAEIGADIRFSNRPGAATQSTRSQDFEPETVSTSVFSRAYVSLQENNAIAEVSLNTTPPRIQSIVSAGTKDYNTDTSRLDASDQDGGGMLTKRPVKGHRQPGGLFVFRNADEVLLLSANTGAPRMLPGYDETTRAATLNLDPAVFPTAAQLQQPEQLGRLIVSATEGNAPATTTPAPGVPQDDDRESILTFGGRSFSVLRTNGFAVYDSGDDFERVTLQSLGSNFNSAADANNTGDTRSDDQGPAPRAITMGQIEGATFAFIGLYEVGGIMVYAMEPGLRTARFLEYKTERNFGVPTSAPDANSDGAPDTNPSVGDLGATQMTFVPANASPTADSLLLVSNTVSGTTAIYAVRRVGN
jgi:hypothetical protein